MMTNNEKAECMLETKYPVLYDIISEMAEQCGEFDVELKTSRGNIRFTSKHK